MELLLSCNYSPSSFASGSSRSSTASANPSATSLFVFGQPANINRRHSQYSSHVGSIPNVAAASTSDLHFRLRPISAVSAQVAANSSSKIGLSIKQEMSSKDNILVFVAGATGRVGSRTVRELLKLGFRVRAGVRSTQRAETLVQSVQQMKVDGATAVSETQPLEMLEIVECDLEKESSIGPAIGDASVVICCIGASEKEVFDVTGPYRIDYKATKNLIQAATVAQVDHFILLTSLGTNKIGFPAAILNLFWGVLIWKRKAEEALIASGLPYTIVRPGGMERPTDSYKETHNTVLANEDTYFGGQVSNLQVAELMAFMAKHKRLSYCKVVEVIAETTAPLTPFEESLANIPPRQELPPEPTPDPVPESVTTDTKVPEIKPLSPFTMYDDLKPPTSPSPPKPADPMQTKLEPTTSSTEKEPTTASIQKTSDLSPYMAYDDLKPPTSPIPTPSSSKGSINDGFTSSSPLLGSDSGNNAGGSGTPPTVNDKELPLNSSSRSPFNVYDDLKPPTTPSPSAPSTGLFISTATGSNNSTIGELGDQKHIKLENSKPLSPYSMYEDLKPPSSPLPSVPKY